MSVGRNIFCAIEDGGARIQAAWRRRGCWPEEAVGLNACPILAVGDGARFLGSRFPMEVYAIYLSAALLDAQNASIVIIVMPKSHSNQGEVTLMKSWQAPN